ncbi:Maestro heat-like repeat family member 5 [Manis javanica]|nr:Maestro heat-like repeat family member 5 [Manis javanica]
MPVTMLRQESSPRGHRLTQIPELTQCLLDMLQRDPNFLATLFWQKIILVIVGLRFSSAETEQSRKNPPAHELNESVAEMCFLLQHTEPWLKSDKSHECKRAAQSIFLLLKYVVDYVKLAVSDLRAQWPQEPGRPHRVPPALGPLPRGPNAYQQWFLGLCMQQITSGTLPCQCQEHRSLNSWV